MLVQVPGTKCIYELQLHLKPMHDLKTKISTQKDEAGTGSTQTGHEVYKAYRKLKETAKQKYQQAMAAFNALRVAVSGN